MKWLKFFLGPVLLCALLGCASDKKWEAEQIPYPRSTPFDASQFARTAYLEGFRLGYRAQMNRGTRMGETLAGPYGRARQLGFYAGSAEARRELESGTTRPDSAP